MTVHLSDRQLLAELIQLGETVLSRPLGMWPAPAFDLSVIAGDLVAAMRCPSNASRIGAGEGILFSALQTITGGGAVTNAEIARFAFIAQQALAIVREHYFFIVRAEANARARGQEARA